MLVGNLLLQGARHLTPHLLSINPGRLGHLVRNAAQHYKEPLEKGLRELANRHGVTDFLVGEEKKKLDAELRGTDHETGRYRRDWGSRYPADVQYQMEVKLRRNRLLKRKNDAHRLALEAEKRAEEARRKLEEAEEAEERLEEAAEAEAEAEAADRADSSKSHSYPTRKQSDHEREIVSQFLRERDTERSGFLKRATERRKNVQFSETTLPRHLSYTRNRVPYHARSQSRFYSPPLPVARGRYVVAADQTRRKSLLSQVGSRIYDLFGETKSPHGETKKGYLRSLFGKAVHRPYGGRTRRRR